MTTLTNSEGLVISHTNALLGVIILQLNASTTYYTTGDSDVIFIKIGSNKLLFLGHTHHTHKNIFQNYIINGNTINDYAL